MISAIPEPLSIRERDSLTKWLQDPAAAIFIRVLKSEHADLVCRMMNDASKHSDDVCRSGQMPLGSIYYAKKAAVIQLVISKLLEAINDQKHDHVTVKLTIE